ncbi:MAG: GGDEF domain-containing protein [Mesorhizobium sp.]|nr:GGDEF domain-containing protein [Mesorhizobium sp.]
MTHIFIRAGAIALFSVAASLLIAVTLVPAMGGRVDGTAWLMCAICPLVIAFPASGYAIWQKKRLMALHDELRQAHHELERAHARLAEKSRRDAMTGFLNREAFFAALEATRRRTDRGYLLLADADHFKRINDSYGHQVGDDALTDIAGAIERAVREDDVIGRIGGEEFGIFLRGADLGTAALIAERIRAEVQDVAFMPAQGKTMTLTVSIGGVVCPPDAGTSTLMREADRRLYQAKHAGRNRIVVDDVKRLAA